MGEDRHGNLFWYFGGIHLYRESKPSGNWEVVAKTRDQWRTLRDSFRDSSDKEEIWFRETIEQNFDPILSGMETEIYSWSKNKRAARKVFHAQGPKDRPSCPDTSIDHEHSDEFLSVLLYSGEMCRCANKLDTE